MTTLTPHERAVVISALNARIIEINEGRGVPVFTYASGRCNERDHAIKLMERLELEP